MGWHQGTQDVDVHLSHCQVVGSTGAALRSGWVLGSERQDWSDRPRAPRSESTVTLILGGVTATGRVYEPLVHA